MTFNEAIKILSFQPDKQLELETRSNIQNKIILVTGGAGYIGSHTIIDLIANGFEVISVDNFSNSKRVVFDRIRQITGKQVRNYPVDVRDKSGVKKIFDENPGIAGIIHFAARIYVNESTEKPLLYFDHNLNGLVNVLYAMKQYSVPAFIFSSSCSVYGNPEQLPVTEQTPFGKAECPYARTKQMGEDIIRDLAFAEPDLKFFILRYFNPGGAHESGFNGEDPVVENTHLIPVITETAIGSRPQMKVFGKDYNTPDGTCLRDYIHVMDLATAHTRAMQVLLDEKPENNCQVLNIGLGKGVTVLQAIRAFERVTGKSLNFKIGKRREGDVEAVYANADLSKKILKWQPTRTIEDIMASAWLWEQRKQGGGRG